MNNVLDSIKKFFHNKELLLKILKGFLYLVAIVSFCFLVYFFVTGIIKSLFEDDFKTAQNRINSAYQFLKMLLAGGGTLLFLILANLIKVKLFGKF